MVIYLHIFNYITSKHRNNESSSQNNLLCAGTEPAISMQ